jgi:alginate O-acetyltransferase complex protein AlgI
MVFSSNLFLFYFFPFFLLLYFLTPTRFKNITVLLASIIFFTWGAPTFIFVVLASILIDFFIVKKIDSSTNKQRKRYLILSVVLNLSLLLYFKYANFFVDTVNEYVFLKFGWKQIQWAVIALPIGISFFTFKKLSYCIDVYRGTHKSFTDIKDYALFILLFPELIAGPIVRFNEIADQINDRRSSETVDNRLMGLFRFIIGLSKKLLIANILGAEADKIFAVDVQFINTPNAWLAILAYTFQIYFDFSGYSDMAIGIAKMIGFKFPENFNHPYTAQSITEFWRRWHITLGQFMRDYLYIPLGGNKIKSKWRLYFNLWVVFLLSGLWHGASWNFVIWGAFHGMFLIADRIFLLKAYKLLGKYLSIIITFFIVMIGWVFFREDTVTDAFAFIHKLFAFDYSQTDFYFLKDFYVILSIAIALSFIPAFTFYNRLKDYLMSLSLYNSGVILSSIVILTMFVLCVCGIAGNDFNPFIYYKF